MAQSHSASLHRVLVVDDDPTLLFLMMEIVELQGVRVCGAADAEEAVEVLDVYRDITAVITDVEMPGPMNGIELAYFVESRWPQIRIFITSGRQQLSLAPMPIGATFVPKPFGLAEICQVFTSAGFDVEAGAASSRS